MVLTQKTNMRIQARLDCLDIKTEVYWDDPHEDKQTLKKSHEIIEITYKPIIKLFSCNATFVMIGAFDCIFDNLCPECGQKALEFVDLSILGNLAGFPETGAESRVTKKERRAKRALLTKKDWGVKN